MKALIVDNSVRLWKELLYEFYQLAHKNFVTGNESEVCKEGFVRMQLSTNYDISIHLAAEVCTAKQLIKTHKFDLYFLDNQIFDKSSSTKNLYQKQLVFTIKEKIVSTVC